MDPAATAATAEQAATAKTKTLGNKFASMVTDSTANELRTAREFLLP
jgi:hypothetical protein